MGITSWLEATPKTRRAIAHEAEECVFELRITIRSVGQSGGDKDMFDSIVEKFDLIFRGRGVKSQGFGYRDPLQSIWGVQRKRRWEIRICHVIPIDAEGKEADS
jgi:hypothetical protein